MARPARDAVRRMRSENPAAWARFALHIAVLEGWHCAGDVAACLKYLDRVLNSGHRAGHAPRNFDLDWALELPRFFADDELTPLFARKSSVAAAKREIEADAEQPKMRKVQPRSRDERRSA